MLINLNLFKYKCFYYQFIIKKLRIMKKLAILSMTFLFAFSVVKGQAEKEEKAQVKETKSELKTERVALRKLEGTEVSTKAKNTFKTDFPAATNVQSKRNNTYDEFTFTGKDGKPMTAFYDSEGNLVGTTQIKAITDVPAKGQQEIKNKYKDYTVGPILFYDDNEGNETDMILYGIQFDDVDSYFVELQKGTKKLVVQVLMDGQVMFFTDLK